MRKLLFSALAIMFTAAASQGQTPPPFTAADRVAAVSIGPAISKELPSPVIVSIPAPEGFMFVTSENKKVYDLLTGVTPPGNRMLISCIPTNLDVVETDVTELTRYMMVQTARQDEDELISVKEFKQVTELAQQQILQSLAEAQKQIDQLKKQMGDALGNAVEQPVTMDAVKPQFSPPHVRADRVLAFDTVTRYDAKLEDGTPFTFTVSCTAAMVHVNGKIIYVYVYGGEEDGQWTRQTNAQWVDAILALNPTAEIIVPGKEREPWWRSAVRFGVVGGLIGGIVGGILNRKNAKKVNSSSIHTPPAAS